MPHVTNQIDPSGGPLINLYIGVSIPRQDALIAAHMPVPQPVQVRLLVDTGASHTVIETTVLQALGLQPTGQINVVTPSTGLTPAPMFQYDVGLLLPHSFNYRFFPTIPVTGSDFRIQNMQGLLGRDILAHCLLVYDGACGMYSLAF